MEILLKKYFWVVNLVVIAVCGIFAGRAGAHFLEGALLTDDGARPLMRRAQYVATAPQKQHGKEPDEIVLRNIFCSGCAPPPSPAPGGAPSADDLKRRDEPQKSTLPLELVSTLYCGKDSDWSMAIIRDTQGKEKDSAMFNRGKSIFKTNAVVTEVQERRVYFRNGAQLEYLELDGTAPPPAVASAAPPPAPVIATDPNLGDITAGVNCTGNACTVDRALVEKLLSNTTMLATAARFVPSIKDGKPNGFKLYAIRPNSIFGKIGLQNGDTIKAINGNEMSTPDAALALYSKLRSASHLSVNLERRGETVTLDYTIK